MNQSNEIRDIEEIQLNLYYEVLAVHPDLIEETFKSNDTHDHEEAEDKPDQFSEIKNLLENQQDQIEIKRQVKQR